MAPTDDGSRIVHTWYPRDLPTGEYLAQDEHGRVWNAHVSRATREHRTGETRGELVGSRVREVW